MDEEDSAEHYDADAGGADANQDAGEDGETARELSESDEVADEVGHVHVRGEAVRAGAAESAEEDGDAVIEECERAGDADEQEADVDLRGGRSGWCGGFGQ